MEQLGLGAQVARQICPIKHCMRDQQAAPWQVGMHGSWCHMKHAPVPMTSVPVSSSISTPWASARSAMAWYGDTSAPAGRP